MRPTHDILFLDHAGVLGGAELSLADIAGHFGDRGRTLLLADGPFRELLERSGLHVEVVRTPGALAAARRESGAAGSARAAAAAAAVMPRLLPYARRARLLYANSQKAFVLAAMLGRLARRPVVWHLRDIMSGEHFSALNRLVTTRLARWSAARVIANSDATRDAFIAAGGPAPRAVTIHNGIDPAPHDAVDDAAGEPLRAELGFAPGDFVVGAFSRLAPWKGQDVLLDALARCEGVHAAVVGDAIFGETDFRDRLRRRIERPDLTGRVRLLGFRRDVPRLMKACHVVVHTATAPEPFGRVIVEGMFARRPVIASSAGGACEIITDDRHGLRVPPGDAEALAAAITSLRDQPARRLRIASAGRRRAEDAFSVRAMLERIERHLAPMLAPGGGQTPGGASQAPPTRRAQPPAEPRLMSSDSRLVQEPSSWEDPSAHPR